MDISEEEIFAESSDLDSHQNQDKNARDKDDEEQVHEMLEKEYHPFKKIPYRELFPWIASIFSGRKTDRDENEIEEEIELAQRLSVNSSKTKDEILI